MSAFLNNKMENNYENYMKQCIELARKGEGYVSPNPLVGAIILDANGNFAGKGWHKKYGGPHAEVNAFTDAEKNGKDVANGTIFVSLEPCSHYGKTPPCADLIIKKGIKKVVIGCLDPNPKVNGAGIKKLKEAGIQVVTGVLEFDCKKLNEIFFKNNLENKPFVAIKTAVTLDGKIATKTGSSKWITSEKARQEVQRLRNKYDAILSGSGTVLADDPSLTCRMDGGRNPVRVIIDSKLKVSKDSKVFLDDGTKVFLFVGENVSDINYSANVEIVKSPLVNEKIDLTFVLNTLFNKGIRSVLVEAGGILNGVFIEQKLADKLYQFIAPKILGDDNSKSWIEGFDITDISDCKNLEIVNVKMFYPDILIEAKFL